MANDGPNDGVTKSWATNASNISSGTLGTARLPSSAALAGSPTTTTQSAGDASTKIATTSFVSTAVANAIAAVNPAVAVAAASNAILPNSPSYNNGVSGIGAFITDGGLHALVVDGYTVLLNDRVLVKNEGDSNGLGAAKNGVYTLTQLGVGSATPWILTRALDFDQPSDMNSTGAIPVVNGTANTQTQWLLTSAIATVGTDAVTFTKFAIAPSTILTTALTNTHLFVGNSSNIATDVALSGDATLANTGALTIASGAVTNAKIANMSDQTVKGNISGGAAAPVDLTATQLTTIPNVATDLLKGLIPATTDGKILVGKTSSEIQAVSPSGDITSISNAGAFTIANSAITNAKLANMADITVKGNVSGGSAAPTDLTKTQLTALINKFTSVLPGAVPASGGDVTTFLCANGNFTAPPGLSQASITLTAAQLKAIHTTPITVVANPGSGKLIELVHGTVHFAYGGTPYTGNNALQFSLAGMLTSLQSASIMTGSADNWANMVVTLFSNATTDPRNSALTVTCPTADYTLGNSIVYLDFVYRIVTIS